MGLAKKTKKAKKTPVKDKTKKKKKVVGRGTTKSGY
jgi:hypothetical protein